MARSTNPTDTLEMLDEAALAQVRGGGFTGGVFVAAGDLNGDTFDDIIVAADAGGGPHVRVFNGTGK